MNIGGVSGLAAGLFGGKVGKASLEVADLFGEVFEDERIAQEEASAAAENEPSQAAFDDETILDTSFRQAVYGWRERIAGLYETEDEENGDSETNIGQHVDEAGNTIPQAPTDNVVAGANPSNNQFAGLDENGNEQIDFSKMLRRAGRLSEEEEDEEKTRFDSPLFGGMDIEDEMLSILDDAQLMSSAELQQTMRLHLGKNASLQESGMILNDLGMRFPNTQAWLAERETVYADA